MNDRGDEKQVQVVSLTFKCLKETKFEEMKNDDTKSEDTKSGDTKTKSTELEDKDKETPETKGPEQKTDEHKVKIPVPSTGSAHSGIKLLEKSVYDMESGFKLVEKSDYTDEESVEEKVVLDDAVKKSGAEKRDAEWVLLWAKRLHCGWEWWCIV